MRKIFSILVTVSLLGVVLFFNPDSTVKANADQLDEFEIMSHNVYFLSQNLYPNWGQTQRAKLISDADYIKNHDVVIFNELFDNEASNMLLDGIQKQYPHQTPVLGRSTDHWDKSTGSYSYTAPEDGGVAIVSKWPIEEKFNMYMKTAVVLNP